MFSIHRKLFLALKNCPIKMSNSHPPPPPLSGIQKTLEVVPSISSRQILPITIKKHWKVDIKLFLYCPILLDFSILFKIFCLSLQVNKLLNKLVKIFQILLTIRIKSFDFFFNFWNFWIIVLKELLENPQVTHSNQSQLIKVKSVQSFRRVFRTHLKTYWKF